MFKFFIKNPFVLTIVGVFGGVIIYFFLTKIFKIEETKIISNFLQKFLPFYD
jgi:hypothetical protein